MPRDGSDVVAVTAYYFCQGSLPDLLQLTGCECCFCRTRGTFWFVFVPEAIPHTQAPKLLSNEASERRAQHATLCIFTGWLE